MRKDIGCIPMSKNWLLIKKLHILVYYYSFNNLWDGDIRVYKKGSAVHNSATDFPTLISEVVL